MVKNKDVSSIKYVYVPCDRSLPLQELTYSGPTPQLGDDNFSENLKSFFATGNMPETGGQIDARGGAAAVDKETLLQVTC